MASDRPEGELQWVRRIYDIDNVWQQLPQSSDNSENIRSDVPRYTEQDMQNAMRGIKRKIWDTIQCTICKDLPSEGQIKQCQNGHLACEGCMNNADMNTCGVCREPLGNKRIRALGVEQLVEAVDLELSCKHPNCEFKAPKRDLISHEKRCKKRLVWCPDGSGEKKVPFHALLDHLIHGRETPSRYNPLTLPMTVEMTRFNSNRDLSWNCKIHKFQDKLFASTFRRVNGLWYAYVYILGDSEEAKKFSVKISIGKRNQTQIISTRKAFPIDAKVTDILKERSGVLSFSPVGTAEEIFQDIESEGEMRKKIEITYEIMEAPSVQNRKTEAEEFSRSE